MNTDDPNMNQSNEDRQAWWDAKKAEHVARLEKMDAQQRLEANDVFNSLNEEFEAATDWSQASWEEFKAKVEAWWNSSDQETDNTA